MSYNMILIVDDSKPSQFLTKHVIKKFDPSIEITTALNGEEALLMLEEFETPPDVIFLDINMPVMNGHEFLEAYTQKTIQAEAVVMLTSSDQASDKDRCLQYDIVKKYVEKPLGLEHLNELLSYVKAA